MDELTDYNYNEYLKCKENYLYFLSHLGITLYEQQKDYLNTVHNDRFTILLAPRLSGKDYTTLPYLLWYALFHYDKRIVILGHSWEESKVLLERIDIMIEKFTINYSEKFISLFPTFPTKSINPCNGRIELSNGSKIIISNGSSSKGDNIDIDILYLSEFAFLNKAKNIFDNHYPLISKKRSPKIIIASSIPSEHTEFSKQWKSSLERISRFTPVQWYFDKVPGFDDKFKEETIKAIGKERWDTEFECKFIQKISDLPKTIGNCPADYFKYFSDKDKKHGYILYEIINQLKGLNYSQVDEIVNILINVVNEKQKNDIFN